ncbi:MAG: hypothetical protein J1F32_00775 [Erysipelotrichales bacterium]|nr:hypothetical protein [Erysipelotrichales bacterium]
MIIIAFDGASGTGKSVMINLLKEFFQHAHRADVCVERIISSELETKLDEFKKSGTKDMHQEYCEMLIKAYKDGYNRLCQKEAEFQKINRNKELIVILDRYLLSLFAIQGEQWGINNLYDRCKAENIPLPDLQFIIQLANKSLPEDEYFRAAGKKFDTEKQWIRNMLSYSDIEYNILGYEFVRDYILDFLKQEVV